VLFRSRTASSTAGPRSIDAYLPPAVDVNAAQVLEMQKKMKEMEEEILQLRMIIKQHEIKANLDSQREAARNPLTFDEKKTLIEEIHQLPPERMEQVVEIIQAAMPNKGEGEEIEIPLDDLDTLTLRKLQAYVASCTGKKKKQRPPGAIPKKPRASNANGVRSPAGAPNSKGKQGSVDQLQHSNSYSSAAGEIHETHIAPDSHGQMNIVDPDDHLLFSPDTLEEMDHDGEDTGLMEFDDSANPVSDQVDF